VSKSRADKKKNRRLIRSVTHGSCFKLTPENWSPSYRLEGHDARWDMDGKTRFLRVHCFSWKKTHQSQRETLQPVYLYGAKVIPGWKDVS